MSKKQWTVSSMQNCDKCSFADMASKSLFANPVKAVEAS